MAKSIIYPFFIFLRELRYRLYGYLKMVRGVQSLVIDVNFPTQTRGLASDYYFNQISTLRVQISMTAQIGRVDRKL